MTIPMMLHTMANEFTYCWSHWTYACNAYKAMCVGWVGIVSWLAMSGRKRRVSVVEQHIAMRRVG